MYSSLLKGRSLRSDKLRLAVNLSRVFFFWFFFFYMKQSFGQAWTLPK